MPSLAYLRVKSFAHATPHAGPRDGQKTSVNCEGASRPLPCVVVVWVGGLVVREGLPITPL